MSTENDTTYHLFIRHKENPYLGKHLGLSACYAAYKEYTAAGSGYLPVDWLSESQPDIEDCWIYQFGFRLRAVEAVACGRIILTRDKDGKLKIEEGWQFGGDNGFRLMETYRDDRSEHDAR